MGFWQVTLRRSIRLSKAYIILGIAISIYGIILSNVLPLLPADPSTTLNTPINYMSVFPILAVAMLSLSALLFSMPIVTLFVYDKNNGVFEYLLSTGLDQLDIFKGYAKAAIWLTIYFLAFSILLNTALGIYFGTSVGFLVGIAILTFSLGISTVFLVTVSMMAFSSLQKTPMGANQPLGVIIGIVPVFPALILPIIIPAYAMLIDIAIATTTSIVSFSLLFSINRLILREKLLP